MKKKYNAPLVEILELEIDEKICIIDGNSDQSENRVPDTSEDNTGNWSNGWI